MSILPLPSWYNKINIIHIVCLLEEKLKMCVKLRRLSRINCITNYNIVGLLIDSLGLHINPTNITVNPSQHQYLRCPLHGGNKGDPFGKVSSNHKKYQIQPCPGIQSWWDSNDWLAKIIWIFIKLRLLLLFSHVLWLWFPRLHSQNMT